MSKSAADLEQAVMNLSADELARFRDWFMEFDAKHWDAQIAKDVKAGKLDELSAKAIEDHRAGKSSML